MRAQKIVAQNKWIVEDASGLRYTFGEDPFPGSDAARIGNDTSTFMQQDPDGFCRFTTAWMLTRVDDPDGNYMEIVYSNVFNFAYPIFVAYGGNSNAGTNHFYHVLFIYENRATKPLHVRRASSSVLFGTNWSA